MSSSGGQQQQQQHRLSRVLFRAEDPEDDEDEESDTGGCGHSEDRIPESSDPSVFTMNSRTAIQPSICITSSSDNGHGQSAEEMLDMEYDSENVSEDEDMSFLSSGPGPRQTSHRLNHHEVEEPSSPFKLNHLMSQPDLTSSPQYLKSVRDLNLMSSCSSNHHNNNNVNALSSSPPTTPKTLTTRIVSCSGLTCSSRPGTGPVSRTRLSTTGTVDRRRSRPVKRSLLTPLFPNVNYFSPTSLNQSHNSSSTSSSLMALVSNHSSSCLLNTDTVKRVRLSDSGMSQTSGITGCRLNFTEVDVHTDPNAGNTQDSNGSGSTLQAPSSSVAAAAAETIAEPSSESHHLLMLSGGSVNEELVFDEEEEEDDEDDSSEGDPSNRHMKQMIACESSELSDPIAAVCRAGSSRCVTGGSGDNDHLAVGSPCLTGCRYMDDFVELEEIGKGTFGTVFKCQRRLDGLMYAVKVSSKPILKEKEALEALREVYAESVLTGGQEEDDRFANLKCRIIQYFSSWATDDRLYIQSEYCAGGSLADLLDRCRSSGVRIPLLLVKRILLQVAEGLKYIHSRFIITPEGRKEVMSHMDIKPENIFLTKRIHNVDSLRIPGHNDSDTILIPDGEQEQEQEEDDEDYASDGEDEDDDEEDTTPVSMSRLIRSINFKIGDLGLVTLCPKPGKQVVQHKDEVEPEDQEQEGDGEGKSKAKAANAGALLIVEGDCRYLANEMLYDFRAKDCTKGDVFSLGMTMVEVMSGIPAPGNGDIYQQLRFGEMPYDLSSYPDSLVQLVRKMMSPDPADRPSAASVVSQLKGPSKSQLKKQLSDSFRENELLKSQLHSLSSLTGHNDSSSSVSPCHCGCSHCSCSPRSQL